MSRTSSRLSLSAAALLAVTLLVPNARAADPERVTMGLDEFLALYEKSRVSEPEAPRDHAIASARYEGRVLVQDDRPHSARFSLDMRVEVLRKKGWARVPLLPATVALQSAKIKGVEAAVVIENGYYTLVTNQRGAIDLDIVFGAAVTTAQGRSTIEFALANSGATSVELSVPVEQDLDFSVAGARLKSDEVVGKDRVVKATLPSTGSMAISWQSKITEQEAAKQQARVYAEVYSLVGIGDGVMRTNVTVNNTILFAGVRTLKYQIPAGMTLLGVKGDGIRDWNLGTDSKLEVLLNYAAEGAYTLTLEMEKVVGEKSQSLDTPVVVPLGVERAKGWLGVEARGTIEIGAGDVQRATTVDVRALPAAIIGITNQPVLLGYKYLGTDPAIPLTVSHHDEVDVLVTLIDQTQARSMWTPEGRRLTSVQYQIRNNRRQFLRLTLPEGAELWSASVGGRAVQPARAKDGRVMVPLVRSRSTGGALAAFQLEVVYVESAEPTTDSGRGTFKATLPRPDVPSTYVAWTIYSPERTKVKRRSVDGTLREVDYHSNPIPFEDVAMIEMESPEMQNDAVAQSTSSGSSGGAAMGTGATPVPVSLPLQGEEIYFEKLIALDEPLEVSFSYRGLRKGARGRD